MGTEVDFAILAGTANPALAEAVARELGVGLGASAAERFPDGEVAVHVDETIRGREVFLVQPTGPPVDTHLVELLALADACRRASAERVTAVIPYFGYARSDKRDGRRVPIAASMVARLLQAVGVDHVVAIDLHTPQVEGFFHVPVDALTAVPPLCEALRGRLPDQTVVVAPDAGRVKMATRYAERLGAPLAVLHKRRASGTETDVTHLVGDVRGRPCLIIDDLISTGGTIVESLEALLKAGARPEITVVATHGLLVGEAAARLGRDEVARLVVTDSVAVPDRAIPRLEVVSVAPLLANAIRRLSEGQSLSDLY